MPWKPTDAAAHNKGVKSAKHKRMWAAVANQVLARELKKGTERAKAEGIAIASANAAVGRAMKSKEAAASAALDVAASAGHQPAGYGYAVGREDRTAYERARDRASRFGGAKAVAAIDEPADVGNLRRHPVLPMPYEHRALMMDPADCIHSSFRSQPLNAGIRCVKAVAVFGKGEPEVFAYYFDRRQFDVNQAQRWLLDRRVQWRKFDTAKDSAYPKMTSAGRFVRFQAACNLTAAAGDKLPTIEILAYTGGLLHIREFSIPVVVDIATLVTGPDQTPIIKDHQVGQVVGHGQAIKARTNLRIPGVISGTGKAAKEVLENHKQGFKWQASIGCRLSGEHTEYIGPGRTLKANGQEFTGPLLYSRYARLKEVSVLSIGADDGSRVDIAAQAGFAHLQATF